MPKKTRQVAELLGVRSFNLLSLIDGGKISPPAKDASGHYLWSDGDISRARSALQIDRRRKEHRRAKKGGAACK